MNAQEKNLPLVVGIGASAGGLQAFRELFTRLANDKELALVLVQHLDPDHKSLLQELLSKRTTTPVFTAEDGMPLEAGAIYLIPPGSALRVEDRKLWLEPFEAPRGQRRPIDTFLVSLARDVGDKAVAIILSGTGSDGSDGVKAIKEAGGLVIAQDPAQSEYDGMPTSAIASGAVDMTLTIEEMADVLKNYRRYQADVVPAIGSDRDFLDTVFRHVRYHTGHDFSEYKQSTLERRLTKRMSVVGITSPSQYVERLIRDRDEAYQLQRDLLINVTGFFRDKDAFAVFEDKVFPELFRSRGASDEIRLWVPGCSTGEEAYSLGMLALAELERQSSRAQLTIFGTDIDEDALHTARVAHYSSKAAEEIPENLLEQFMVATTDGYAVGKRLRAAVRFSQQSLTKDPPFSRLDLISCRNVLIYFEKRLQQRAMNVFHYSLNTDGFLILGTSETAAGLHSGFVEFEPKAHLYKRNDEPAAPLDLSNAFRKDGGAQSRRSLNDQQRHLRDDNGITSALLERHSPPHIIVGPDGAVVQLSKSAERFLKVRGGNLDTHIGTLIHPSLESILRRLNSQAPSEEGQISAAEFQGDLDGETVSLEIRSEVMRSGHRFFVFNEMGAEHAATERVLVSSTGDESEYVKGLEQELDDARQTLRTTIEELETSNEELKSSNEEMMSMNEELQSANEELSTANDELQSRLSEVNELNSDLRDFVSSTSLATVFLDSDLNVRRFTSMAEGYFKLVETDVGRPLEDLASSLPLGDLLALCRQVMDTTATVESELTTLDGEAELKVRVVPRLDQDDGLKGVVFTLIDVTELRRYATRLEASEARARQSLAEVEELYRVSPAAMALLGPDTKYIRVNQRLAEINGAPIEAHMGKTLRDIVPELGDSVVDPVLKVFETGVPILDQEIAGFTAARPDEERTWIVDWYPLRDGDEVVAVGVNVRDVTQYAEMQSDLRRVMRELQHRVKNMLGNVTALVNRARQDERDPDVVLKTLYDRLFALGKTHQLLAAENWGLTSLKALVKSELTDVYGKESFRIRGPELLVAPQATLAIGMALHELATNAAKYGALSAADGHVNVTWSRTDEGDGEILRLTWKEEGGPQVTEPTGHGFGTTLITATISGTLDGEVRMSWERSGLVSVFEVKIENVVQQEDPANAYEF
ncbi:MAG: chemotaxis protein CheB [Pseudomonadota bacterium]